jgi:D-arabinose 1-dehydrogenase-like Zn-dependent alcohol dehydrogenase
MRSYKKDLAKKLGADEVVVVSDRFVEHICTLGGIDVLLHTGNASKNITVLLEAMNPEGRVVMGIDSAPIEAPVMSMIHKQLTIVGSTQNRRKDLYDILQLAAIGRIDPMIELYGLHDLPAVVKRLEEGKVRF